jgi:hypothetical protein
VLKSFFPGQKNENTGPQKTEIGGAYNMKMHVMPSQSANPSKGLH